MRKTAPDGAGLLVTSAVIDVEWSSRDFGSPVKVRHAIVSSFVHTDVNADVPIRLAYL